MHLRICLLAVALLASATLQARTPYGGAANDRIAQAFRAELPALRVPAACVTPPPVAQPIEGGDLILDQPAAGALSLEPLPSRPSRPKPAEQPLPRVVDDRPRQSINIAAGLELSSQGLGGFGSIGYMYRVKGNFWVGGLWQATIGYPVKYGVKLLEMNYWELDIMSWLAIRFGVGVGAWVYDDDTNMYGWGVGRLTMQWVVRLGRTVSLTCAPFVFGPSYVDLMFGRAYTDTFHVSGEYCQLGLSFRF